MMGVCLAPTTFSTAPTSVGGYTAPTLNMNPGIIPNCSTVLSKVIGTYTILKTDSCYSDFYSGWSPSTRDGPQPTPEGGSGPGHLVPRPQSSVTGGLGAVGGPGLEGPGMIPTALPASATPGMAQPINLPSSNSPQVTNPLSPPQPNPEPPGNGEKPGQSAGGSGPSTPAPSTNQPVQSAPVQPISIPPPVPVITLGSSTVTQDSSSNFIIGSQTLAPGGSITHSGTVLSLARSGGGVVFGPSTQAIQPAPSAQPLPVITVAGSTVTGNAASQFQIGTQTLVPGAAPITHGGQVISLAPSASAIVLGSSTQQIALPSGAPAPVITVGSSVVTQNSAGQFIIGTNTLDPNSTPITVAGRVLSLAPFGTALILGPSTQALATPPQVIATSSPVLTIGNSAITPDASSNYVIAEQTLRPGAAAITISGMPISLAPSATAVIMNGQTQALTPSKILVSELPPLITLGSTVLSANSASAYLVAGQTLIPGSPAITVSGTAYSLAPSAIALVVGTLTEKLSPQLVGLSTVAPVLTVGTARVAADAGGEYTIAGQTLRPGAAITVSGTKISLASDDSFLAIGSSTETLHPATRTTGLQTATSNSTSSFATSTANSTMATSTLLLSSGSLTGSLTDTPTLTSLVETAKATSPVKKGGSPKLRISLLYGLMSISTLVMLII